MGKSLVSCFFWDTVYITSYQDIYTEMSSAVFWKSLWRHLIDRSVVVREESREKRVENFWRILVTQIEQLVRSVCVSAQLLN